MSIIISGIKLPFNSDDSEAIALAAKQLRLNKGQIGLVCHKSLDLRKGGLSKVVAVEFDLGDDMEEKLKARFPSSQIRIKKKSSMPIFSGTKTPTGSPVIIGFGPAGLFASLILAENGYRPLVLERGGPISVRDKMVEGFALGAELNQQCNIQFGEGGAGTYSDGKLTTRINDVNCDFVLRQLVRFGAPENILSEAKPHIGTDLLKTVVVAMRNRIIELGGRVEFFAHVNHFKVANGKLCGISVNGADIECETAILAIGHSARDTLLRLYESEIEIEQKPFSAGVRIEHLQNDINKALYGKHVDTPGLPQGEYALSHRTSERACYTFCMCPGGHVVAAASELGGVVTNGMSYNARDGINANSALCVSIATEDFMSKHPLAGIELQRTFEHAAFKAGKGDFKAPVQKWSDFCLGKPSDDFGRVMPTYPRGTAFVDLNTILPNYITDMMKHSMPELDRKLRGFCCDDALLTGLETRTSSPVRIKRTQDMFSTTAIGLIPCGEGAGYAGGIMSAAVDGIKAAQKIMAEYCPPK